MDKLQDISHETFKLYLELFVNATKPDGTLFSANFDFIEKITPTAFVRLRDGLHFIGIHNSLAVVIHEFSLFCFAQQGFFPSLGDTTAETSPKPIDDTPPGLWLYKRTLEGMTEVPDDTPRIVPVDPHRAAYAHYLTLLMLRFVWLHELGHGLRGHVDYLRDNSNDDQIELDELGLMEVSESKSKATPTIKQVMEFEADQFAMAKSMAIQALGLENIDGIKAIPVDVRLRLTLFSVYAMTYLFEAIQTTLSRSKLNIKHPTPFTRLQNLQNTAILELDHLKLDTKGIVTDAIKELGALLNHIGEDWQQKDRFEPNRYKAVFDQLCADLEPYRYLDRS